MSSTAGAVWGWLAASEPCKDARRLPSALVFRPRLLPLNNHPSASLYTILSGNFEFGLARVMRSLEPLPAALDAPRWRAVALCLLAALDQVAKHMLVLKDALVSDLLAFLEDVEAAGKGVHVGGAGGGEDAMSGGGGGAPLQTVWAQARALRALLMKMHD